MNDISLDSAYFSWLTDQISSYAEERVAYSTLLKTLYETPFDSVDGLDDNRVVDGIFLRKSFLFETGIKNASIEWVQMDCSFFEMLVAISSRMSIMMDYDQEYCFWKMLNNMRLVYSDDEMTYMGSLVVDRIEKVINRSYESNGEGSIFPLQNPPYGWDSTKQEVLIQMYEYIKENT